MNFVNLPVTAILSLVTWLALFSRLTSTFSVVPSKRDARLPHFFSAAKKTDNKNHADNDEDWTTVENAEVLIHSEDQDDDDSEEDWKPDRERAKQRRLDARIYAERIQSSTTKQEEEQQSVGVQSSTTKTSKKQEEESAGERSRPSAYTDEEEEVISAMGGKTHHPQRKREPGFLGDSTLQEIATDYSVPICYLADVLYMWGVPAPIHVEDRLGDLVTGEQAFAILEAVNSLDIAALHDRYANTNLINLCAECDIDLQQAFEMAMKEGWSLPFGVQTCLRVEQEDELVRVLGNPMAMTRATAGEGYNDDDE